MCFQIDGSDWIKHATGYTQLSEIQLGDKKVILQPVVLDLNFALIFFCKFYFGALFIIDTISFINYFLLLYSQPFIASSSDWQVVFGRGRFYRNSFEFFASRKK